MSIESETLRLQQQINMNIKERTQLLNRMFTYFGNPGKQSELLYDMGKMGLNICGGAITSVFSNAPINDLDFYLEDLADLPRAIKFFEVLGFEQTFTTDTALSFQRQGNGRRLYKIQLITYFVGKPDEIFGSFDFTICCGAYSFRDEQFNLHPRFLPDLAKRKLVYMGGSRFPICALYRTVKYQKRGYSLPGSTAMHLGLAISRLDILTYADLKAQLRGIDTLYLFKFLEMKPNDMPFDYADFVAEAFERIDGMPGEAEKEDEFDDSNT